MSTLSRSYRKKGGKRPMSMKKRGGKSAMSMKKCGGKSAMSMKKRGGGGVIDFEGTEIFGAQQNFGAQQDALGERISDAMRAYPKTKII